MHKTAKGAILAEEGLKDPVSVYLCPKNLQLCDIHHEVAMYHDAARFLLLLELIESVLARDAHLQSEGEILKTLGGVEFEMYIAGSRGLYPIHCVAAPVGMA